MSFDPLREESRVYLRFQTVKTLQSFMLAMVLYPDAQAKAHAQLDRVSPGRLPGFTDYDSLPYIQAVVLETLRWNPVAPEGASDSFSDQPWSSSRDVSRSSAALYDRG